MKDAVVDRFNVGVEIGQLIPERDKLQMKIESRGAISFSWSQAKQIAGEFYKLDVDDVLKRAIRHVVHSRISKWSALCGVVRFENQ